MPRGRKRDKQNFFGIIQAKFGTHTSSTFHSIHSYISNAYIFACIIYYQSVQKLNAAVAVTQRKRATITTKCTKCQIRRHCLYKCVSSSQIYNGLYYFSTAFLKSLYSSAMSCHIILNTMCTTKMCILFVVVFVSVAMVFVAFSVIKIHSIQYYTFRPGFFVLFFSLVVRNTFLLNHRHQINIVNKIL